VTPDGATLRQAPKVLLHDHLDGGLRPTTVVELAEACGHVLPTTDPEELEQWFFQGDRDVDLVRYLDAFSHTVAVLQTRDALARVATEAVEDLAADGVLHAEIRFAPELSTAGGLSMDEVIGAVLDGLAAASPPLTTGMIVCAMRDRNNASAAFEAAARHRDHGVVAVDLAGPEAGHPAARHAAALRRAAADGLGVTLHAGEADGPPSIADALDHGAERIGHGVRITGDLAGDGTPGPIASRLLAGAVPLEVCPTSNLHTGVAADLASHPVDRLRRAGFTVTINTDNRLMSRVSLTDEFAALVATFGYGLDDVEALTVAAARSTFLDEPAKTALLDRVGRGYAALREPRAGRAR